MPEPLKLVVGLGNPGTKYADTRHNAGFWFLDRLAASHGISFKRDPRLYGELAHNQDNSCNYRLFKPQTYMNESGRAVRAILDYYRIRPAEMLVVYDEIDLPPGTVRLKEGGGHAGHNGLRDIIDVVGTRDFNRLRIGVGHPGEKEKVIDSVLGRPTREEKKLIDASIERALKLMSVIQAGEFRKAMTVLHFSDKQQATSDKNRENE